MIYPGDNRSSRNQIAKIDRGSRILIKKTVSIFILAFMLTIVLTACGSFGEKLTYGEFELYYTDKVTKAEADKLMDYLLEQEFTDGENPATVQLNKSGSTYEFRMVVKKGLDTDPDFVEIASYWGAELSEQLFNDQAVDVHLCDDRLETLRVVLQAY